MAGPREQRYSNSTTVGRPWHAGEGTFVCMYMYAQPFDGRGIWTPVFKSRRAERFGFGFWRFSSVIWLHEKVGRGRVYMSV
jgi:hypothetical protein